MNLPYSISNSFEQYVRLILTFGKLDNLLCCYLRVSSTTRAGKNNKIPVQIILDRLGRAKQGGASQLCRKVLVCKMDWQAIRLP